MKKKILACALVAVLAVSGQTVIANAKTNTTESVNTMASAARSTGWTGKITGNMVAMRRSPDINSTRLYLLPKGTKVQVTSSSFGTGQYWWYQVRYKNTTGYIVASYIG